MEIPVPFPRRLQAFYDGIVHGELLQAAGASMLRLLISFALSLAIGTTLGFLFARYRFLDDTLGLPGRLFADDSKYCLVAFCYYLVWT